MIFVCVCVAVGGGEDFKVLVFSFTFNALL